VNTWCNEWRGKCRDLLRKEKSFFSLTDLNGLLRNLLADLQKPVIIHLKSRDFVLNTLDRVKTFPQTFLKVQFSHFSKNPWDLFTWTDFLANLIDDTWVIRCEVTHFHQTLLNKLGQRTKLPCWEIITRLNNIVLLL